MSKKRSCDNNKAIKMVRNALPKLKKDFSDIGTLIWFLKREDELEAIATSWFLKV